MSGFTGNDGSALIGGLNPSGAAQAAIVDAQGRFITSLYGKGNGSPGDTALLLDSLGQMTVEDFIRYQIMLGHGFHATTGLVASGAANAFLGMQAIINNAAKNILIYNVLVFGANNAACVDARLYQAANSTADAALTNNLLGSIKNQQPASGNTSVMSALWGSPASYTQTGSFIGTQVDQTGSPANQTTNILQSQSIYWFKAGDVATIAAYAKVTTSGNNGALSMDWIEF